jgi:hypothetical protein
MDCFASLAMTRRKRSFVDVDRARRAIRPLLLPLLSTRRPWCRGCRRRLGGPDLDRHIAEFERLLDEVARKDRGSQVREACISGPDKHAARARLRRGGVRAIWYTRSKTP